MKNKKDKTVRVCLVQGVEGPSCYINDYRVCGNKPWGGEEHYSIKMLV